MITRGDVIFCYKAFLGRNPENENVINEKLRGCGSCGDLIRTFTSSEEYLAKNEEVIMMPPLEISDCTEEQRGKVFRRVSDEWDLLGKEQPFWSVLTNDIYKTENIKEEEIKDFYAGGSNEVEQIYSTLFRNRLISTREDLKRLDAFELGCGVGRVTIHLQKAFKKVYGADISQGNLDIAERYVGDNVELIKIDNLEQYFEMPQFDFLYSVIVLQHNCPPVMEFVIDSLLAKLRPGGIALLQMPTYFKGYKWDYEEYMTTPKQMEMHVLPQHRMFEIIKSNNCVPVEVAPYDRTGKEYHSMLYTIRKA